MDMELETRIGAMAFRLAGITTAVVPSFELRPLSLLDGATLSASADPESPGYMVIDHRREASEQLSRVEFWEPLNAGEAPLNGLFAFCEPAAEGSRGPAVETLAQLRSLIRPEALH
jgi:hypothetical protein